MGALLALIPARDWFYGALAVGAALFAWDLHHKYEAAVTYQKTVQAESAKAQADSAARISALTNQYDASLKATQEAQNVALQEAANQSAGLNSRLRQYTANRCTNGVLSGAAAATAGTVAGAGSAGSAEPSVDDALRDVISAAAHDNAVIEAERAERDSLTGK